MAELIELSSYRPDPLPVRDGEPVDGVPGLVWWQMAWVPEDAWWELSTGETNGWLEGAA